MGGVVYQAHDIVARRLQIQRRLRKLFGDPDNAKTFGTGHQGLHIGNHVDIFRGGPNADDAQAVLFVVHRNLKALAEIQAIGFCKVFAQHGDPLFPRLEITPFEHHHVIDHGTLARWHGDHTSDARFIDAVNIDIHIFHDALADLAYPGQVLQLEYGGLGGALHHNFKVRETILRVVGVPGETQVEVGGVHANIGRDSAGDHHNDAERLRPG